MSAVTSFKTEPIKLPSLDYCQRGLLFDVGGLKARHTTIRNIISVNRNVFCGTDRVSTPLFFIPDYPHFQLKYKC